MSQASSQPVKRRPRCAFHYKIDETLRDADRAEYLSLIRDPRTTVDAAHSWLLARGYTLSRSAVARHRRRTLSGEAEQRESMDRALAFARLAGGPEAPDFAAGAAIQLQHLVFERLMIIGEIMHAAGVDLASDEDDTSNCDEQARSDRITRAMREIPSSELLTLSKLVGQCVDLAGKMKLKPAPSHLDPVTASPPETSEQRDARERARAEEILFGGRQAGRGANES